MIIWSTIDWDHRKKPTRTHRWLQHANIQPNFGWFTEDIFVEKIEKKIHPTKYHTWDQPRTLMVGFIQIIEPCYYHYFNGTTITDDEQTKTTKNDENKKKEKNLNLSLLPMTT